MEQRRLYRSEQDRMLAGVCGGLGDYLGIDPTVVRIVFVVLGLFSGVGVVLYLAMWVIVPVESRLDSPPPEVAREGVEDIKDRARQGVQEARDAFDRLRGRGQETSPPPGAEPPGAEPGSGPGGGRPTPEAGPNLEADRPASTEPAPEPGSAPDEPSEGRGPEQH